MAIHRQNFRRTGVAHLVYLEPGTRLIVRGKANRRISADVHATLRRLGLDHGVIRSYVHNQAPLSYVVPRRLSHMTLGGGVNGSLGQIGTDFMEGPVMARVKERGSTCARCYLPFSPRCMFCKDRDVPAGELGSVEWKMRNPERVSTR